MYYEIERLNLEGRWLKTGKWTKKYKLLSDAHVEAAVGRGRGSVVRIIRVADDGSRYVEDPRDDAAENR